MQLPLRWVLNFALVDIIFSTTLFYSVQTIMSFLIFFSCCIFNRDSIQQCFTNRFGYWILHWTVMEIRNENLGREYIIWYGYYVLFMFTTPTTYSCTLTKWGLEKVSVHKFISLPQRRGRETVSHRPLAHDKIDL